MRVFDGIVSVPHNIVVDLNNVVTLESNTIQTLVYIRDENTEGYGRPRTSKCNGRTDLE